MEGDKSESGLGDKSGSGLSSLSSTESEVYIHEPLAFTCSSPPEVDESDSSRSSESLIDDLRYLDNLTEEEFVLVFGDTLLESFDLDLSDSQIQRFLDGREVVEETELLIPVEIQEALLEEWN